MMKLFMLVSLMATVSARVTQVHMAQGKDPSSMVMSWTTEGSAQSQVRLGTAMDADSMSVVENSNSVVAEQYTFVVADNARSPRAVDYTSPFIHHVTLSDLKASTKYYYQAGDFSGAAIEGEDVSGMNSFTTLATAGDFSEPVRFGVLGDLGTTRDSVKTVGHIMQNKDLQMILHVGDLSYANCDQSKWDLYGRMIEPLAATRPWMVGSGNHEIELALPNELYVAFESRYKMPSGKPAYRGAITHKSEYVSCTPSVFQSEYDYGNSFWSFDASGVHTINLNPYSVTNATSTQMAWLLDDLASVDRSVTPWLVVMMHDPWYNSNTAHHDEWQTVKMKADMEETLYNAGVNVVFSGHVHAIERSFPTYKDEVEGERGITYVNIGDAGNAEGHASNYYDPSPVWSAFRNGTQYGHGEFTLYNSTHAEWAWIRNIDGEAVHSDSLWICNAAAGMRADCA
jgi:predicted phosphodiesterase